MFGRLTDVDQKKEPIAYTIAFEREGLSRRWKVYATRMAYDEDLDDYGPAYEAIGNPLGYEDLEEAGRVLANHLDLSHVPF